MANTWDVGDDELRLQLEAVKDVVLNDLPIPVMLFKNDYTPTVGTVYADLTEADFAGYTRASLPPGSFGSASETDHVAITISANVATFTASGIATTQTIYGYACLNEDGDTIRWVERFETPRTVEADYVLMITPEYRLRTYPASS